MLVAVLGLAIPGGIRLTGATPVHALTPPVPIGPSLASPAPVAQLSPTFLGANVIARYPLNASTGGYLNSTPVQLVRWPGGGLADRYNLTANQIYNDSGSPFTPRSSLAQFAAWCTSAHCHAIVQLPTEINRSATAAFYVNYTETTLGFHPDYWELGNEPAAWTHFGLPWTQWNTTQRLNATPGTYAETVQSYAAAMKAVDPGVRIIGLAGVGTGTHGETVWIRATVERNGPNLSGVGIHVYPAGTGPVNRSASLAGFFQSLSGPSSLFARVPLDRAAVLEACPGCSRVALFVTELGSGATAGTYLGYMSGFAQVTYLAAEITQAIALNLSSVDLFAFEGTYAGSLLGPQGTPQPTQVLYHDYLSLLGPEAMAITTDPTPSGLYLAETCVRPGDSVSLLVVNTNTTRTLALPLAGLGLPTSGTARAWTWNGSTTEPVLLGVGASAIPASWYLPPLSVSLLTVRGGGLSLQGQVQNAPATAPPLDLGRSGLPFLLSLFAMVAPTGLTFPCWATLLPSPGEARPPDDLRARLVRWLVGRL